jgi:hypothetical protein
MRPGSTMYGIPVPLRFRDPADMPSKEEGNVSATLRNAAHTAVQHRSPKSAHALNQQRSDDEHTISTGNAGGERENAFSSYFRRVLEPSPGDLDLRYVPAIGDANEPDLQMHYEPTPYRGIIRIIKKLGFGRTTRSSRSVPVRGASSFPELGGVSPEHRNRDRPLAHDRALDNVRRSTTSPAGSVGGH